MFIGPLSTAAWRYAPFNKLVGLNAHPATIHYSGYTYMVKVDTRNEKLESVYRKLHDNVQVELSGVNLRNFVFSDGKSMDYYCDIYQKKYDYSDEYLNNIRQKLYVVVMDVDYSLSLLNDTSEVHAERVIEKVILKTFENLKQESVTRHKRNKGLSKL